jgi:hypothetical protein
VKGVVVWQEGLWTGHREAVTSSHFTHSQLNTVHSGLYEAHGMGERSSVLGDVGARDTGTAILRSRQQQLQNK